MAKGRGNPVQAAVGRKVISQSVVNPVGNAENTTPGNPAALRGGVKSAPSKNISQKVGSPSYGADRAKASKPIPGLAGKRGK